MSIRDLESFPSNTQEELLQNGKLSLCKKQDIVALPFLLIKHMNTPADG